MRPVSRGSVRPAQGFESMSCICGRCRNEDTGIRQGGTILRHSSGNVKRHQALDSNPFVLVFIPQGTAKVVQVSLKIWCKIRHFKKTCSQGIVIVVVLLVQCLPT